MRSARFKKERRHLTWSQVYYEGMWYWVFSTGEESSTEDPLTMESRHKTGKIWSMGMHIYIYVWGYKNLRKLYFIASIFYWRMQHHLWNVNKLQVIFYELQWQFFKKSTSSENIRNRILSVVVSPKCQYIKHLLETVLITAVHRNKCIH